MLGQRLSQTHPLRDRGADTEYLSPDIIKAAASPGQVLTLPKRFLRHPTWRSIEGFRQPDRASCPVAVSSSWCRRESVLDTAQVVTIEIKQVESVEDSAGKKISLPLSWCASDCCGSAKSDLP